MANNVWKSTVNWYCPLKHYYKTSLFLNLMSHLQSTEYCVVMTTFPFAITVTMEWESAIHVIMYADVKTHVVFSLLLSDSSVRLISSHNSITETSLYPTTLQGHFMQIYIYSTVVILHKDLHFVLKCRVTWVEHDSLK